MRDDQIWFLTREEVNVEVFLSPFARPLFEPHVVLNEHNRSDQEQTDKRYSDNLLYGDWNQRGLNV